MHNYTKFLHIMQKHAFVYNDFQFMFDVSSYHRILCPEFPDFLEKYLKLPLLVRLKDIGLLCGTDFTPLYSNRFYYSRFDHSAGCALIAWNFTRDKKQALASLLHDVSTPVFSHVGDFRKGDALKQEATESLNQKMIFADRELKQLLETDGLCAEDVCDYHAYPVCDNEIPCLSSDRLEYMFPSGMALCDFEVRDKEIFDMESVRRCYENITVLKNESGRDELGFKDLERAVDYTKRFCEVAMILQRNENKLALNMLGKIVNLALENHLIREEDLYLKSEREIIRIFDEFAAGDLQGKEQKYLVSMIRTWRTMKKIERFDEQPGEGWYSVSLEVKRRYINPLVKCSGKNVRVRELSADGRLYIEELMNYKDTKYGAVLLK